MLLILARALHIGASLLVFGLLFFEGAVLPRGDRAARFRRGLEVAAIGLVLLALLTGTLWFVLAASGMAGVDPWYRISWDDLQLVATQTRFGGLWILRGSLAAILILLLTGQSGGFKRCVCLLLAAGLAASLAWAGHAGSGSSPWHLIADVIHLLVAGIWPMGLFPLLAWLILVRETPESLPVARRFSDFAVLAVLILLGSGWINSWYLIGSWERLFHSPYGHELMIKLAVFGVMVGLGFLNRRALTRKDVPHQHLILTVALESLLTLVVLGVVGAMGSSAPPH